MPEYLAPGVFVEEVSFRSRSIEGVTTSTTGFVGMTRTGPSPHEWIDDDGVTLLPGPARCAPRLVSSFAEFEQVYGGLDPLRLDDGTTRLPYLAHAARAFFMNGGTRLFVSRVYRPPTDSAGGPVVRVASAPAPMSVGPNASFRARWPGEHGNALVTVTAERGPDVAVVVDGEVRAKRVSAGAVVEVLGPGVQPAVDADGSPQIDLADLAVVSTVTADGSLQLTGPVGAPPAGASVRTITLRLVVRVDGQRPRVYRALATHPSQRRDIGRVLQLDDPEDPDAVVWFDHRAQLDDPDAAARMLADLVSGSPYRLTGGTDGALIEPTGDHGLEGRLADPDVATNTATGLRALDEIEEIAIVAAPDMGTLGSFDACRIAGEVLIAHVESPSTYRVALIDPPLTTRSTDAVRSFRREFDSADAAMYHPWVRILDPQSRPTPGVRPDELLLPPSGFIAGIYARNDSSRGVHRAPTNELVHGIIGLAANITSRDNEVLGPEGINVMRSFERRGHRVWGARTMSSDPASRYIGVRRLMSCLEHSIERATRWTVFEPNDERLWGEVRLMVEDFLAAEWRKGALLGSTPDEAYFVRCDRTTMTHDDIDSGRLVCLIGVAPTTPAEFVIFRVCQHPAGVGSTPRWVGPDG